MKLNYTGVAIAMVILPVALARPTLVDKTSANPDRLPETPKRDPSLVGTFTVDTGENAKRDHEIITHNDDGTVTVQYCSDDIFTQLVTDTEC